MAINEETLNQLLEKAVVDFGATWHTPLVVIGDRLGLYKALHKHGPLNSEELADKTGTAERYVREWLSSQAAGGYISYNPDTKKFYLTEEQAFMLADENSPAFVGGAFQSALATVMSSSEIEEAFKTGEGFGWHQHDEGLFHGTERFFRPGYAANLVENWIPSLEGVHEKLQQGARVADIGCGFGASTILMARAYPNSTFEGFDYHDKSIEACRQRAKEAGISDRVSFNVSTAKSFSGKDKYDFVTTFDCLHDMGDPAGAAAHILDNLKPDGTWMIVEPYAGDKLEENLNPVGRAYYSVSTLVCTPCSLSQEVGKALGAQAGEARIREVVTEGGLTRFRRATETPFNLIFEARP